MYELAIIILIALDQASKIIVKGILNSSGSLSVIDNIFYLTYVENRGAAFGMFQNMKFIFVVISVIAVVVGLIYIHKSKESKISKIAVAMIVSGAIGNLIDRVRLGYVIDFFDFRFIWNYVFNFADVLVVVGTFVLCVYLLVTGKDEENKYQKENKNQKKNKSKRVK